MRTWTAIALILGVATGCGSESEADVAEAVEAPDRAGLQAVAVEVSAAADGGERGEIACEVLRSGALVDVFGVMAEAASYTPGSNFIPHGLCTARWDRPNRAELDAARLAYEAARAMATVRRESFDDAPPPPSQYEVSLTIIAQEYDSPAAAVASLEGAVAQLGQGVEVEVPGGNVLAQVDFEPWVEGIGDRAAWARGLEELSVAHDGVRYAVLVRGFDDAARNRDWTTRLAQRLTEPG